MAAKIELVQALSNATHICSEATRRKSEAKTREAKRREAKRRGGHGSLGPVGSLRPPSKQAKRRGAKRSEAKRSHIGKFRFAAMKMKLN